MTPERERRRVQLFEPQRTLVGHFRHESGHYYWSVLIADSPWHERVRALFGDERADYAAALSAYYANGPSATLAGRVRHGLRQRASLGGLGGDVGAPSAHDRLARDGRELRPVRAPPASSARTMSAEPGEAVAAGATFDTVLDNWSR